MADKTVSSVDQALIDAIQKAQSVGGEIYDGAKKVTGQAIDLVAKQAPDLIHQLLVYNFVYSLAFFVLGLVMFFGSIWFAFFALGKYKKKEWNADASPLLMFLIFPCVIGGITSMSNLTWLKIWLAPKIWLIEYVASLLK